MRTPFQNGYIDAIYFTEQPPDRADLSALSLCHALNQCSAFWDAYKDLIPSELETQAGHDFWLTRNHHGAGFWDRPELYGTHLADVLTRASHACGAVDVDFE